ncbi:MAG: hypothetical protein WC522_06965 [Candidatus Omnitrophota bacterium]
MSKKLPKNSFIIVLLGLLLLNAGQAISFQDRPINLKKSQRYETIPVKVVGTITLPKGWHEGLSLNGGCIWISNGKSGNIWVIDMDSGRLVSDIEPVADFTEAVVKKTGDLFFTTDWDQQKLYLARLEDNKLEKELWVSFPGSHPAGILWDGERLFVIIWKRGLGTRFELLEFDGNLNYSNRISIQDIQEPAHIAWDGANLWITSWYEQLVYKVDVKRWEIVGAFRSPVSKTTGIVWDGKYLWLTGTYSDLYKLEIAK